MQYFLSVLTSKQNTLLWNPPRQISREKCMQQSSRQRWGREDLHSDQIQTRWNKDSALKEQQVSSEILKNHQWTLLSGRYTQWGECKGVCWFVCLKACVINFPSVLRFYPEVSFISDPLHRPGWSFWCAAGGLCATGPDVRLSQTPLPASGRQGHTQ